MEYLVRVDAALPEAMSDTARQSLLALERARGRVLYETGVIRRIWRIPGSTSNIGIWAAHDADELHDALSSLPIFPWASVQVTALATHPLEAKVRADVSQA